MDAVFRRGPRMVDATGGNVGQRIKVNEARIIDDSVVIATDRSLTGTDGESFATLEDARSGSSFPARLAVDLFESDGSLTRVFVAQNVVIAVRGGGWTDEAVASTSTVIEEFLLFYPAG